MSFSARTSAFTFPNVVSGFHNAVREVIYDVLLEVRLARMMDADMVRCSCVKS